MVRCARCHFSFEPETRGLLPPCSQCGGETELAATPAAPGDEESWPAHPTTKMPVIKTGGQ